jgi:protein-S-isoprenylcysteine O-methyltransferase Ste14
MEIRRKDVGGMEHQFLRAETDLTNTTQCISLLVNDILGGSGGYLKTTQGRNMSTQGQKNRGVVSDIQGKGDLTPQEIKDELWDRNVSFVRAYDRTFNWVFLALGVLWFLPSIAQRSGWRFLSLFARLPEVDFPVGVIVVAVILFLAAIALETWLNWMRQHQGGCHDTHETVVIVREGPYRVIRHPGYLAEIVYFSLSPIVFSRLVPFTALAEIAIVLAVASFAYLIYAEDSFNVRKWGDGYREYMADVPAINFVQGLKRLREESDSNS